MASGSDDDWSISSDDDEKDAPVDSTPDVKHHCAAAQTDQTEAKTEMVQPEPQPQPEPELLQSESQSLHAQPQSQPESQSLQPQPSICIEETKANVSVSACDSGETKRPAEVRLASKWQEAIGALSSGLSFTPSGDPVGQEESYFYESELHAGGPYDFRLYRLEFERPEDSTHLELRAFGRFRLGKAIAFTNEPIETIEDFFDPSPSCAKSFSYTEDKEKQVQAAIQRYLHEAVQRCSRCLESRTYCPRKTITKSGLCTACTAFSSIRFVRAERKDESGEEQTQVGRFEQHRCDICHQHLEVDDALTTLPCLHVMHLHCITKLERDNLKCPLCRCDLPETTVPDVPGSCECGKRYNETDEEHEADADTDKEPRTARFVDYSQWRFWF